MLRDTLIYDSQESAVSRGRLLCYAAHPQLAACKLVPCLHCLRWACLPYVHPLLRTSVSYVLNCVRTQLSACKHTEPREHLQTCSMIAALQPQMMLMLLTGIVDWIGMYVTLPDGMQQVRWQSWSCTVVYSDAALPAMAALPHSSCERLGAC